MLIYIVVSDGLYRQVGENLHSLINGAISGVETCLIDSAERLTTTRKIPDLAILCLKPPNLGFEVGFLSALHRDQEDPVEILVLEIDAGHSRLIYPWLDLKIISVDNEGLRTLFNSICQSIPEEARRSSASKFDESAPIFIKVVQELIRANLEDERLSLQMPPMQFLYSDDSFYEANYPDHWLKLIQQAADAYNPDTLRIIKERLDNHPNKNDRITRALFDAQCQVRDFAGALESYEKLSAELKQDAKFVSLYAMALVGSGRRQDALNVLQKISKEKKDFHPEIMGLLGRIYKDLWQMAVKKGDAVAAKRWLKNAADAYTRGFKKLSDKYHLGVNAVSLLHLMGDTNSMALRDELLPLVQNSIEKSIDIDNDYWALASLLELSVIKGDRNHAAEFAKKIAKLSPDEITLKTTAAQLELIFEASSNRKEPADWVKDILIDLGQSAEI